MNIKKSYDALKDGVMNVFFNKGRVMRIIKGPLRGYRYVVKRDTGFSSILGRWERRSQLVYQHSIFKDFVVFDLGANFGIHSMLYSKLVGKNGKVFAFEPLPGNVADIQQHINVNHIENIEVIGEAISDKTGVAEFKIAGHQTQGSLVGIGRETGALLTVKTDTLDNFCASRNVIPDFVKIDIEGAEGIALAGFHQKVALSYPFFSIDLHTPECDREVGKFLAHYGYEVYRVNDSSARAHRRWNTLLEKIDKLDEPWPNPTGIWGVVWAVHPSRKAMVADFIAKHSS
jgi:FkbM family methyltransferase